MRVLSLLAPLLVLALSVGAQSVEETKSVMAPITQLFTGMNLGDSAMVHQAFVKNPTLASVSVDKSGVPNLRTENLSRFLNAIGTPHADTWSEPIWDVKIQIDGNLAQVWSPYAFFIGKKFSHCGVDTFQLFKGADGQWRIFYLADTRKTEGCNVPQAIKDQFK